ncbi:hypothetical protein [Actinomadura sp. 21ATH]|uniref:hypothetical protein n=1 Tax=Actinomadura sp. 21ATH TaxID=1735444 RepID=UPI0035BFB8DA
MSTRLLSVGAQANPALGLAPLPSSEADARTVARVLPAHLPGGGVDCRTIGSGTSAEFNTALRWLYDPSAAVRHRILYYSGHAVMLPSQSIALALSDSDTSDARSFITAGLLGEYLVRCPKSMHTWFLDCCYAQGLSFSRLPETVQQMLDHRVFASSSVASRTRAPATGALLSPYTRALIRGIKGIAYRPDTVDLTISDLAAYLSAEAAVSGFGDPYLRASGSGSQVLFQKRLAPRSVIGGSRPSRTPPRPRLTVVLGEAGAQADTIALKASAVEEEVARLDGRSRIMLDLSKAAAGYLDAAAQPALLEGIDARKVWDEVRALIDDRHLMITGVDGDSIPADIIGAADVHRVAGPNGDDVLRTFTSLGIAAEEVTGRFVDDILQASAGSHQEMARITQTIALIRRFDGPSMDDSAVDMTVADVVELVDSFDGRISAALALCACAPGVYLPLPIVLGWVSRQLGAGGARLRSEALLSLFLRGSGALVTEDGWICVPTRYSGVFAALRPEPEKDFLPFLRWSLSVTAESPDAAVGRLQLLRAAALFCEQHVGRHDYAPVVDGLLALCGLELFAASRLHSWLPIIDDAIDWIGDRASARFLSICGHAYRLADHYDSAGAIFMAAAARTTNSIEELIVRSGIVAATKNSDGFSQARLEELSAMAERVQEVDEKGGETAAWAIAHLLFQRANVDFARSRWDIADSLYSNAERMLAGHSGIESARLMVDVLKGRGDVAIHRDERGECVRLADRMLGVVSDAALDRLGRVGFAKVLQFMGDLARRRALPRDMAEGLVDHGQVHAAVYWYERSLAEYDAQELLLGTLLCRFKIAEVWGIMDDYQRSFECHLDLLERFHDLGNGVWEYKSAVCALKLFPFLEHPHRIRAVSLAGDIRARLDRGTPSEFQQLWGRIALAAAGAGKEWEVAAGLARNLGLLGLAASLDRRSLGKWIFAYY